MKYFADTENLNSVQVNKIYPVKFGPVFIIQSDSVFPSQLLAFELITDMICKDPNKRPNAKAILRHPYFWNAEKILNFLQVN